MKKCVVGYDNLVPIRAYELSLTESMSVITK